MQYSIQRRFSERLSAGLLALMLGCVLSSCSPLGTDDRSEEPAGGPDSLRRLRLSVNTVPVAINLPATNVLSPETIFQVNAKLTSLDGTTNPAYRRVNFNCTWGCRYFADPNGNFPTENFAYTDANGELTTYVSSNARPGFFQFEVSFSSDVVVMPVTLLGNEFAGTNMALTSSNTSSSNPDVIVHGGIGFAKLQGTYYAAAVGTQGNIFDYFTVPGGVGSFSISTGGGCVNLGCGEVSARGLVLFPEGQLPGDPEPFSYITGTYNSPLLSETETSRNVVIAFTARDLSGRYSSVVTSRQITVENIRFEFAARGEQNKYVVTGRGAVTGEPVQGLTLTSSTSGLSANYKLIPSAGVTNANGEFAFDLIDDGSLTTGVISVGTVSFTYKLSSYAACIEGCSQRTESDRTFGPVRISYQDVKFTVNNLTAGTEQETIIPNSGSTPKSVTVRVFDSLDNPVANAPVYITKSSVASGDFFPNTPADPSSCSDGTDLLAVFPSASQDCVQLSEDCRIGCTDAAGLVVFEVVRPDLPTTVTYNVQVYNSETDLRINSSHTIQYSLP